MGLCVAFYDYVTVGQPFVYPGEGSSHQHVKFRVGESPRQNDVTYEQSHLRVVQWCFALSSVKSWLERSLLVVVMESEVVKLYWHLFKLFCNIYSCVQSL